MSTDRKPMCHLADSEIINRISKVILVILTDLPKG